ncbi:MAG: phosphohydrolase [Planctomycetota bacterium]
MTPLYWAALELARHWHTGQVDKAGRPYILHPIAVSADPLLPDDTHRAVALLHDVIEDTDCTGDDLRAAGMPDLVVENVKLLTKPANGDYNDYIQGVASSRVATAVKRADIRHNTHPDRLGHLDSSNRERLMLKYAKARKILDSWAA